MPLPRLVGASVSRLATFPLPARRTGRADFPHLGSHPGSCPSPTEGSCSSARPSLARFPRARPGNARLPGPVPSGSDTASSKAARPVAVRTAPLLSQPAWAATPFASACSAFRCLRTSSGASRLSPVSTRPFLLPALFPNQGPFAPAALPAFPATTGPSATLPAPAGPRGFQVGACAPPTGLPVLLLPSSSLRASANTPAETSRCPCRSLPDSPSAFPYSLEGRLPQRAFRGLLGVHSRSGPQGR